MDDFWLQLGKRRYKPSEAEKITGVSTDLQRKWIERHFKDDVADAFYHWRMHAEEGHSRYTWAGVQALALFGEIMGDLGVDVARDALRRGSDAMTRLNDFEFDFRDRESGDLFLFYAFEQPDKGFTTTTLKHIETVASPAWSSRIYLCNLSAMQRRLAERAADLLKTELARAAA